MQNAGPSEMTTLTSAAENTNKDSNKPPARLLVVDDDSDVIYVLKHGLLNYGFLVDAFTNPEVALQSFKSNPESYSLILVDRRMTTLSGIELAKKLKEINLNVKVLLLTGVDIIDNEVSKEYHSKNVVDGFVQKPISIRVLADKILSLISETRERNA
jgi:two-component system cell cycle sensor histidine kinase/response regulator CckA